MLDRAPGKWMADLTDDLVVADHVAALRR
ncbi:hypothetical protein GGD63_006576 [Bradyrhizobium sp. cir1]|nr:hypothetical protein [Bradyrhizobium sp. cir1]